MMLELKDNRSDLSEVYVYNKFKSVTFRKLMGRLSQQLNLISKLPLNTFVLYLTDLSPTGKTL